MTDTPALVSQDKTTTLLTKDEFCARFKARMVSFLETFDDGNSVAEYADEIGPTYYGTR